MLRIIDPNNYEVVRGVPVRVSVQVHNHGLWGVGFLAWLVGNAWRGVFLFFFPFLPCSFSFLNLCWRKKVGCCHCDLGGRLGIFSGVG